MTRTGTRRALTLVGSLLLAGCVTTNQVRVGGIDYLVADVSVGVIDTAIVAVTRPGIDIERARRTRRTFERVAEPRFAALCERRGKRPTTDGLRPRDVAEFTVEEGFPTWTFGRRCVSP